MSAPADEREARIFTGKWQFWRGRIHLSPARFERPYTPLDNLWLRSRPEYRGGEYGYQWQRHPLRRMRSAVEYADGAGRRPKEVARRKSPCLCHWPRLDLWLWRRLLPDNGEGNSSLGLISLLEHSEDVQLQRQPDEQGQISGCVNWRAVGMPADYDGDRIGPEGDHVHGTNGGPNRRSKSPTAFRSPVRGSVAQKGPERPFARVPLTDSPKETSRQYRSWVVDLAGSTLLLQYGGDLEEVQRLWEGPSSFMHGSTAAVSKPNYAFSDRIRGVSNDHDNSRSNGGCHHIRWRPGRLLAEISVRQISTDDGVKVEISAPGLSLILSPAAADKLRLWLDQWITDSVGEPPVLTTGTRTNRRRSR